MPESNLKHIHDTLQEKQELYHKLAENFPNGSVFVLDTDLRYVEADGQGLQNNAISKETMIGKTIQEVLPAGVCQILVPLYRQALTGKHIVVDTLTYQRFVYGIQVIPLHRATGEIYGIMVITLDQTARTEAEQTLRQNEAQLRTFINNASQAYYLVDRNYRLQLFNRQAADYFRINYNQELAIGRSVSEFATGAYGEALYKVFQRVLAGEDYLGEFVHLDKNGNSIWRELRANPVIERDGTINAICATFSDITGRKLAEKKLKDALAEKEVLLKEVHHRVKNNLQIISSLLNLQSAALKDKQAIGALRESQQRVRAMATVHEQLYQSSNLAQIEFRAYLKSLTSQIVRTYGAGAVKLELKGPDKIWLKLDHALPCGLVVNELVTNALRHAFSPEFDGSEKITIEIKLDDVQVCLIVSDNGRGLPEGFNLDQTESLGLPLVKLLTEQLAGKLEIDRTVDQTTRFKLYFKI